MLYKIRNNPRKPFVQAFFSTIVPERAFYFCIKISKNIDPACGCGNFLVIAYRELRLLEIAILRELLNGQMYTEVGYLILVDVDQFCGIEIEEFPAQIAQVSLWLMDHQMNMKVSKEFGRYFTRLPLAKKPNIVHGNALELDWGDIIKPDKLTYILGNPPFVGKQHQSSSQAYEMSKLFEGVRGAGVLDYVAAWFLKAAQFIQGTKTEVAFVATNSIVQGEQTGILWGELFGKYKINIRFAHRTFQWISEARGAAAVHCVIIGFLSDIPNNRVIFDYETPKSDPTIIKTKNINSYLVDAANALINKRNNPICNVPRARFGSMPNDGGYLLMTDEEKHEFIKKEPKAEKRIYPFLSASEYLNNENRWCFWLKDANPVELKGMPLLMERINGVRKVRIQSTRATTKQLALTPTLFGEDRQPNEDYILIPCHSSENRRYIPMGFFKPNYIAGNSCLIVAGAELYHFGILMSHMHMTWVRHVCGRIKSDYRYSASIVYNNYPWPEPSDKQRKSIENVARDIVDIRERFGTSSLADLYDPTTMPPELTKAHLRLDRIVENAYEKSFSTDISRISYLFERYLLITSK